MLIRWGKKSGTGVDFFSDAFPRIGKPVLPDFSVDLFVFRTKRFGMTPIRASRPKRLGAALFWPEP
jgi:hypothetical protein